MPCFFLDAGLRARDLIRKLYGARGDDSERLAFTGSRRSAGERAAEAGTGENGAVHHKGRSSRNLQQEFEELRKRYWGQHLWARGYFCATVGAVDEETIKRYIEEQRWDDDGGDGFKVVGPPSP